MHTYIYIYIYTYRERERDTGRATPLLHGEELPDAADGRGGQDPVLQEGPAVIITLVAATISYYYVSLSLVVVVFGPAEHLAGIDEEARVPGLLLPRGQRHDAHLRSLPNTRTRVQPNTEQAFVCCRTLPNTTVKPLPNAPGTPNTRSAATRMHTAIGSV